MKIDRKISRVALLKDFTGSPDNISPQIDEVAGKGYRSICISADITRIDDFKQLCKKAYSLGLSVCVFTAYMKYQQKYLSEHPEQRLISAREFNDQDNVNTGSWGCPFNPEFKERYLQFLRSITLCPGVIRIWLNDEAYLPGSGCYCHFCRQSYKREFGGEIPLVIEPKAENWQDESWRQYIKWNIDRWNNVHGEMARAIHEIKPDIKVIFQTSPICDIWLNPWSTSVDLAGMAEQLDGLCTDPYYTFHRPPFFTPVETYQSEWARFLKGITGRGKITEIIPQGLTHPTYIRPLGEEDGIWTALVPAACGIDIITPYCYSLQKCSPVLKAYENCFHLDSYFEKTDPLDYAAIVHGVKTEIYMKPLPVSTPLSFDGTRILPVAQSLRHSGVPYGYIPDRGLKDDTLLGKYKVLILPEVNCLSEEEENGIRRFAAGGGKLVILGQLGIAGGTGARHGRDLLYDLCGIKVVSESRVHGRFQFTGKHPAADRMQLVDEDIIRKYSEGVYEPLYTLNYCVEALLPPDARILAEFTDENRVLAGKPAIVSTGDTSNILWFAGFPSHTSVNEKYGTTPRNLAHQLFALLIEWTAGERSALRVEDWPPDVPIKKLRPLDVRYMSTFEFFPLAEEDIFIGVVVSYFKEPASFAMLLDIPVGRKLAGVTELLGGCRVPFEVKDGTAAITVNMGFDTYAQVFLFELGS